MRTNTASRRGATIRSPTRAARRSTYATRKAARSGRRRPCPRPGRRTLRHAPWLRLQRVRAHRTRHHQPSSPARRSRSAGEVLHAEIEERFGTVAQTVGHRLRRMGARRPARENRDARRHGARCNRRAAGAQCVQHRVSGPCRLLRRRQPAAHAERRSHRVHRPQWFAAQAGRDVAAVPERTPRRRHGSMRRHSDPGRAGRRRITRSHLPPRCRHGSRGRHAARRALPAQRFGAGFVRRRAGTMAPAARRNHRALAGSRARRAQQRMAAVSGHRLQAVGAQRLLPIRRRIRLSRSIAGRDGAGARRRLAAARSDHPQRFAAVHRRRRAALVASAGRSRRAHAMLGRLPLASAGDGTLHRGDGG